MRAIAFLQDADAGRRQIGDCNFTDATVAFERGHYSVGHTPDVVYLLNYAPTAVGPMRTDASIKCPDGGPGPCATMDRLRPLPIRPGATARGAARAR